MKNSSVLFLLVISNLCFGILPILVKLANQAGYSAVEETFFRFVVGLLGVIFLGLLGWRSLKVVNRTWVFWRGFLGALSVIGYFVALQTTSSGVGTLLNYTYILWANVFAILFFRQKPPQGFLLCLALAVVGVDLVLDARLDHLGLGEMAGIFSGITGGAAILAIKRCRETDTVLTIFGSFSIFSLIFSSVMLFWGRWFGIFTGGLNAWITPDGKSWWLLILMGLVAMAAQVLFTEAFGKTSLALGSFLTLSVPVLAALFGWLFLAEPLTPHFGWGMFLVLTACGIMVWQENRLQ